MSLRLRLIVAFAIPLALSLLFGCALVGWHATRSVRAELTAALEVGRQSVRSGIEELASSADPERDLRSLVHTFDGNRHVRAALLDPSGTVLGQSRLLSPAVAVPGWFRDLIGPRIPPSDIAVPSNRAGALAIRLQADPTNEAGEVWGEFSDTVLALAVFCLLALAFITWTVRRLLHPIGGLVSGLSRIGSGDYDARVAEEGPAEFATLASGFNLMAARLTEIEAQNLRLQAQIARLQEEERAELARDLHDEIGPSLFAISVTAATIGELAKAGRSAGIPEQVQAIRNVIAGTQRHIKDILSRLRPVCAIELGLCPAVQSLIAFWRTHCPTIAFAAELSVDEAVIGDPLKEAIYRIVQEALSNAVRHGRPSRIEVAIASGVDEVVLKVSDNGTGSPVADRTGFGLIGMRERVAALAGTIAIEGLEAGSGWRVVVRLPLPATVRIQAAVS
jgi:two-component system, NarL family, sensor histidine kinase UhpB